MDIISQIDLEKHVLYSPLMEKIIKEHLQKKYQGSEVGLMWEKVQQQYAAFLKDLPYLGGKKNTHNGTGGTYDCIMIFAYYEALNHEPDMKRCGSEKKTQEQGSPHMKAVFPPSWWSGLSYENIPCPARI